MPPSEGGIVIAACASSPIVHVVAMRGDKDVSGYRSGTKAILLAVACVAGALSLGVAHAETVVLFDEGHGQRFLAERDGSLDLSGLAALFKDGGIDVRTSTGKLDGDALAGVDGLIISGPFSPIMQPEIESIVAFVEAGGSLCVMLHIPPTADELLLRLGVVVSTGVVRESSGLIDDEPLNFKVDGLRSHELTRGLEHFNVFGIWGLKGTANHVEMVAATGPRAWLDLNGNKTLDEEDAVQSFGLLAAGSLGKGRFAVFGDDAVFQNRFLDEANTALGRNLVLWMTSRSAI